MSSQSDALQRLEERLGRVQTELTRDLVAVRDSQTRLEQRVKDLPQQQRTASLPGETIDIMNIHDV